MRSRPRSLMGRGPHLERLEVRGREGRARCALDVAPDGRPFTLRGRRSDPGYPDRSTAYVLGPRSDRRPATGRLMSRWRPTLCSDRSIVLRPDDVRCESPSAATGGGRPVDRDARFARTDPVDGVVPGERDPACPDWSPSANGTSTPCCARSSSLAPLRVPNGPAVRQRRSPRSGPLALVELAVRGPRGDRGPIPCPSVDRAHGETGAGKTMVSRPSACLRRGLDPSRVRPGGRRSGGSRARSPRRRRPLRASDYGDGCSGGGSCRPRGSRGGSRRRRPQHSGWLRS